MTRFEWDRLRIEFAGTDTKPRGAPEHLDPFLHRYGFRCQRRDRSLWTAPYSEDGARFALRLGRNYGVTVSLYR